MKFEEYYERVKPEIDSRLSEIFSLEDEVLKKILSHSVRGGKRFRPVLVVLSCDALKGDHKAAVDHAVVVELLHTASLALKQLDFIPESEYKEALQDVVGFMLRKLAAEGGNEVRRIIKNII